MKILVVYYSRSGNTKKVANEIAAALSADVEEIVELKSRAGTGGYLGAGADAILQKATPIAEIKRDIGNYDLVIVGTPVWFFTMASGVRSFLMQSGDKIKRSLFFATMGGSGDERAFRQMQEICQRAPLLTATFVDRQVKNGEYAKDLADFTAKIKTLGNI